MRTWRPAKCACAYMCECTLFCSAVHTSICGDTCILVHAFACKHERHTYMTHIPVRVYGWMRSHTCMSIHTTLHVKPIHTLISIMIVFFLAQKKTIFIPNAENKDRSSALWLRNLNLSFFYGEKKDSHYGNQSIYMCPPTIYMYYIGTWKHLMYTHTYNLLYALGQHVKPISTSVHQPFVRTTSALETSDVYTYIQLFMCTTSAHGNL
jgi:hypothetical protein